MERIIKIDEALYNTIKRTPYSPILGWREIAQSIPYIPIDDCISRSVLDEIRQLYKDYQPNLATEVIEFGEALEKLIDNAETVSIPTSTEGDLISRSALIRAVKTECNPYGKPTIDFESGKKVLKIIENAPTIFN